MQHPVCYFLLKINIFHKDRCSGRMNSITFYVIPHGNSKTVHIKESHGGVFCNDFLCFFLDLFPRCLIKRCPAFFQKLIYFRSGIFLLIVSAVGSKEIIQVFICIHETGPSADREIKISGVESVEIDTGLQCGDLGINTDFFQLLLDHLRRIYLILPVGTCRNL